jgi:hypothetical protein
MKPALVDVPVLILFFNRPQQLSQVFEQVKKARPSRLFLYQDGARNEHDLPGIKACREIVSQIDWECEVERFYQEKNFLGIYIAEMGFLKSRQMHCTGR